MKKIQPGESSQLMAIIQWGGQQKALNGSVRLWNYLIGKFLYGFSNMIGMNVQKILQIIYIVKKNLIGNNSHLDSLWIIGHSLGGGVTSLFAEKWDREFPITIHSISAPLAGMDSRGPDCENISKKVYKISSAVSYTQWKTVHAQDGAFRNLKFDPQEVFIDGGTSILLPGKWKNSRLGHNRSIQWVSENL